MLMPDPTIEPAAPVSAPRSGCSGSFAAPSAPLVSVLRTSAAGFSPSVCARKAVGFATCPAI
jgi:hypothetical protein